MSEGDETPSGPHEREDDADADNREEDTDTEAAEGSAPESASLSERFPALARLGAIFARPLPVIRQNQAADCGAACLAMVLAYHGKELPLEVVREVMGVGRDGVSALNILKAARWYQLRARGVKVEDLDELESLPTPAVLHWGFNHFIVLERVRGGAVDVVDPAYGRRRVPLDLVRKSFTGVAILFEPSNGFVTRARRQGRMWDFVRRALASSHALARIVTMSFLLQLFALAVPLLTGVLVDRVVPKQDRHLLLVLSCGLLSMVAFHFVTNLVRGHLLLHLKTTLDWQTTLGFLEHLVDLPYSFFQTRPAGDLINRLNSNANIREILTSTIVSSMFDGSMALLYLAVLFVASRSLALLVLALGAVQVLTFLLLRGRQHELASRSLETQVQSQSYLYEVLAGIETLKASGTEQRALDHWSDLFVDELNVNLERGRLAALVDALLGALKMGSPLAVLAYGGYQVIDGQLSLGNMLALNSLAIGFLLPLSTVVGSLSQFQMLGTYLHRINDVLETEPEQDRSKVSAPSRLRGNIALDRVSFRYSPLGPLVVKDVTAQVRAGRMVALVGRSGCGKSTLARLLVGLYPPTAGRILYDGVDLTQIEARGLRSQIGIVTQNAYIFGRSIRQNIALAVPSARLETIVEAARLAGIHDDIAAMPMGYETMLADGGHSLSGGQRQRIALARALIHRPAILLLDEATSALDTVTEAHVQRSLESLGCTRIVIAHRLSTIAKADLILVMDDGLLVEHGTHAELVAAGGHFAAMIAATATGAGEPRHSDEESDESDGLRALDVLARAARHREDR